MIIDSIHRQFSELGDMRAREIRVDKQQRKVFCTLSYPNVNSLAAETKASVIGFVKTMIPQGYGCAVSFVNDVFTEISFRKLLFELLKNKYPIFSNISKENVSISVNDRKIALTFSVDGIVAQNMETSAFQEQLVSFFKEYTCYVVEVTVKLAALETASVGVVEQEKLVQLAINRELLKPSRYFSVYNVEKHIGKVILSSPMYISDIRSASDSCVICGNVSNKTLKASRNNPNMYVCKFTLTDASGGSIPCIIFVKFDISDFKTIKETMGKGDAEALTLSRTRALANDKKMKKMMDIYDTMSVIVRGKVSFNSYSEQLEMCVYDLCKCQISPLKNVSAAVREPVSDYALVKPEVYQEYLQTSFVDKFSVGSLLKDKNYVVLHANATGVNVTKDKIYAICGVKVVDGHISEKFFTYINPEILIDDGALKKSRTSNDKLLFYPTITEIIADLYKFVYGCEIVGVDSALYLELLDYYAAPIGYHFDNPCVNQTELISDLFDNSLFDKKPNCSKVDDVAKSCKVSCDSATFCFDTATAVAKCLTVLSSNAKL